MVADEEYERHFRSRHIAEVVHGLLMELREMLPDSDEFAKPYAAEMRIRMAELRLILRRRRDRMCLAEPIEAASIFVREAQEKGVGARVAQLAKHFHTGIACQTIRICT